MLQDEQTCFLVCLIWSIRSAGSNQARKLTLIETSPDSFRETLHLSRRFPKDNTRNPDSAVYMGPDIPSQIQLAPCSNFNPIPAPIHKIWSEEVTEAVAMGLMVAEDTDIGGVGSDAVIAFSHCAVEHLHMLTFLIILRCGVGLVLHLVLHTMLQITGVLHRSLRNNYSINFNINGCVKFRFQK